MSNNEKHTISISGKLYNEIKEYCTLNELKLNFFVETLLSKAFRIEKFGATPFEARGEVLVLEPAKDLVSPDERAEKAIKEVVNIIGEDAYFGANKELAKLVLGPSAEEVKELTAKIADNIPQEVKEVAPKEEQKNEGATYTTVRNGNKKVTRLN